MGLLFENLVVRDLRVFLSTYPGIGNDLWYYRDDKGLEIDAIVELGTTWGAIEIKLSDSKVDEAAQHLLALRAKLMANASARTRQPAFLAIVVGKGGLAYQRSDGVLVIPASTLGA